MGNGSGELAGNPRAAEFFCVDWSQSAGNGRSLEFKMDRGRRADAPGDIVQSKGSPLPAAGKTGAGFTPGLRAMSTHSDRLDLERWLD